MAAQRLIDTALDGRPVAYLFGELPMMAAEAYAFSNLEAGTPTEHDLAILRAWLVKMTLVHGTWVADRCPFIQV
jgi:hypothetical protein